MKLRYTLPVALAALLLSSCQNMNVTIGGKPSCCDKIIIKCTPIKSLGNDNETPTTKNSVSGSEDILKALPFSTLIQ